MPINYQQIMKAVTTLVDEGHPESYARYRAVRYILEKTFSQVEEGAKNLPVTSGAIFFVNGMAFGRHYPELVQPLLDVLGDWKINNLADFEALQNFVVLGQVAAGE